MAHDVTTIEAALARKRARENGQQTAKRADNGWQRLIQLNKQNHPYPTVANISVILAHDWPAGTLEWNEFFSEVHSTKMPPWDTCDVPQRWNPGRWSEHDDVITGAWLARHWSIRAECPAVRKAVVMVAQTKMVHPIRDWLDACERKWDGEPRLDNMLSTYCGAPATDYERHVSQFVMLGAVARIYDPGCKLDTMMILEGPQGAKKSTWIRVLVGDEYFSDSEIDLSTKDRYVALRGKWGIEIQEIDGYKRHDAARIKAFVSSPVDTYRPPYARGDEQFKRQCFFVGTTNKDQYLTDETGNRRYLSVKVGTIDIDAFARDREQLWGEAVYRYIRFERWWPEGEIQKLFASEQAKRMVSDPWEPHIEAYIETRDWVTVSEILGTALGIEPAKQGQAELARTARILQVLGRIRKQRRINGKQTWGYVTGSSSEVVT